MQITRKRNRFGLSLLAAFGGVSALGVTGMTANADSTLNLAQGVTSGSFDLTTQVGDNMTFPIMFDRPSGVNAAALAGTIRGLGTNSQLYKSALAKVPDLADDNKMNTLLSDALNPSSANYNSARADIVALINWYNSLGGTKITTQGGQAYTVDNLDKPINVLAVAFSNKDSINQAATTALSEVNASKNVGDLAKALDKVQSGLSTPYNSAFDQYAAKVYAPGANVNDLGNYSQAKPVLDAYESMYSNGASAIRKQLLNGQAASTEAGVTFFESAVLAGSTNTNGSNTSDSNKPNDKNEYHTRWVDEKGNNLTPPTSSDSGYDGQKNFDGYHFVNDDTDDGSHTKTYHYEKDKTPEPSSASSQSSHASSASSSSSAPSSSSSTSTNTVTHWVDENGNKIKDDESGSHPDVDGNDVPGYTIVRINTDKDGNVTNVYKKNETPKPTHTEWVDEHGNHLRNNEDGNHPDTDGNDVPGYTYTGSTTDKDGNTINHYKKTQNPKTYWVDEHGDTLKNSEDGQHPDNDGVSDIPGYKVERIYTVTDDDVKPGGTFNGTSYKPGDVINIYKKDVHTNWVDKNGHQLKPQEDGAHPDNDGKSDIPGYKLISTTTDKDGNVTNTYEKDVHTNWIDTNGKQLKPQEDGAHPDNDGKSDIPGYTLVSTNTDKDGNVTNVYKKNPQTKWVDTEGKQLKNPEDGQHPDNDGVSDIPGYTLVKVDTDKDGNVTNIYKKNPHTNWVDEQGNHLKPQEDGQHPDNDGVSDIPGYTFIRTDVDKDGNVTNVYKKNVHTNWVDEQGNKLKPQEDGAYPDNDGKSDIPGYTFIRTDVDKDGNVTNVYKKNVHTEWVDENGKHLKDNEDGEHPDNDGVSDIKGYTLVKTYKDKDGNIINVYKKNVHTEWVDENGKHLKANEDGKHPDDDGKSDIPGYELVRTYVDKDGNVINVYKKIPAKKPAAPATPATPATPAAAPDTQSYSGTGRLPQTGSKNGELTAAGMALLSSLGLGGLIAKRRKREE